MWVRGCRATRTEKKEKKLENETHPMAIYSMNTPVYWDSKWQRQKRGMSEDEENEGPRGPTGREWRSRNSSNQISPISSMYRRNIPLWEKRTTERKDISKTKNRPSTDTNVNEDDWFLCLAVTNQEEKRANERTKRKKENRCLFSFVHFWQSTSTQPAIYHPIYLPDLDLLVIVMEILRTRNEVEQTRLININTKESSNERRAHCISDQVIDRQTFGSIARLCQ